MSIETNPAALRVAEMFYDGHNITYIDSIPGETRETLCRSELARKKLKWNPKINVKEWLWEQL